MIENQRGHDGEARLAFAQAEELLPDEPLASYYLGKTLLLIGDNDGGIAALRRAIERKPAKADALPIFQELGRACQRLRRAEESLAVWQQMEATYPGDLQVQEQIANILEDEGANKEALQRFTSLAASTKDRFRQVELGVRTAVLKIKLNQHTEALSDLEKLLSQVNPGSWLHQDIRRRIDDSFQSRHDFAGLTAYYQRWVDQHPEDIDAMLRIGRLLASARNTATAKEWFLRAMERAPSAIEPRLALVETLERDGNWREAAAAMGAISQLQPDNADYLVRWGELLLADTSQPEEKRSADAAGVWRRLLDKHGDDPVMVSRVADLLRGARLSEEAVKLYTRAVELAENEPQYREYLGEYLIRLGRKEEALNVWRQLAAGPRRHRDNLIRQSELLSTFGFPDEALAAMGEACQMQPTLAQRLRYCEKLVNAARFADALNESQLALRQATTEEERDQVLGHEIKALIASGQLGQRIDELEEEIAQGKHAKLDEAWKRLALYQESDGKTQPALDSIKEALKLAPQSASILNITARLQERAGLMGQAVASLRKLIALERRGQARILMQIAAIHVRLGQMEEAISTAQEMLTMADAGTDQYRYFADLCFQSGKTDQGLDALRRNLRANPNDREAIELLARALSNQFQTAEAIELNWRSFARASSRADKLRVIHTLTDLALRTDSFDELVKRLEAYGREENRAREAIILTAAAHQSSGDLTSARQLLEPLLSADSRDGELLAMMVDLAQADGDWDAAAELQAKLNKLSPTPEGGMQLAKFLLEKGDVEQAESVWKEFARQKMSIADLEANMRQLLLNGETDKTLNMIQRTLEVSPDDWESLTLCMQMLVRCKREAQAKQVAERILKLNLPVDTLSEQARQKLVRAASNPQLTTASPTASPTALTANAAPNSVSNAPPDTDRLASALRASQIVFSLAPRPPQPMTAALARGQTLSANISPVCFGDARYLARYFCSDSEQSSLQDTAELEKSLKTETNVDKLWDTAFLLYVAGSATNQFNVYRSSPMASVGLPMGMSVAGSYRPVAPALTPMLPALKRLAELDDELAQLTLVKEILTQRQMIEDIWTKVGPTAVIGSGIAQQLTPGSAALDEQLSLLKKIQNKANLAQNGSVVLLAINLATDLQTAGRDEEAQQQLAFAKKHAGASASVGMADAFLRVDVNAAIDIYITALRRMPNANSNTSATLNFFNESLLFLSQLFDRQRAIAGLETTSAAAEANRTNPLRLITELKKLSAEKARRMRPSQLATYTPENAVRYIINNGTRGAQLVQIPFPSPSALQSSELLAAMYLVHQDRNNLYRDELDRHLRAEAAQADEDPMQSAIDHLCLSIWLWWRDEHGEALKEMEAVRQTAMANDLVCLLSSRMLYETGRIKEAIAQLQTLKPTTALLLQERDMAILHLALRAEDNELAVQTAERLQAMRLPIQAQSQLVNYLRQMGKQELANKLQLREQRQVGSPIATLSQKMRAHQQQNNPAAALEIARQILRITRASRNPSGLAAVRLGARNDSNYRREALEIVGKAPATKDLIAQLEEKVRKNPKVTSLTEQLADLYEATGRGRDAVIQLIGPQTASPAKTSSAIEERLTYFRQTRAKDSVKGYLEIFEQHPELLDREFSSFRNAIQQHRGWDAVASALSQWPIEKLSRSSQWPEIIRMTISAGTEAEVDKLTRKLMESDDFQTQYIRAYASANQKTWSPELQELFAERLTNVFGDPTFKTVDAYGSSNIRYASLLPAINNMVSSPTAAKKILASITPLSESRPILKCMEVVLLLTANDGDGAARSLEQALSQPADPQRTRMLYDLATVLVRRSRHDMAVSVLESELSSPNCDASIKSLLKAMLLNCYETTKEHAKAKAMLDEQFAELRQKGESDANGYVAVAFRMQAGPDVCDRYLRAGILWKPWQWFCGCENC